MQKDVAFQMSGSNLRFGPGVTREIGLDLKEMSAQRVMVVTDPRLAKLPPVDVVRQSLDDSKIAYDLYDRVRVEPSDESFQDAIKFASAGDYDAYVAVGGGSSIDTAKAANLYATWPAEFMDYVNAPIGAGRPVPGPLKPLIAVPTTAGTGSETTGITIFDLLDRHCKTGIRHRRIRPTLGIIDPENTRTLPPQVAAASGLDVLCHALESFTAKPFTERPYPESPNLRPAYQGSNPISDIWSLEALRMTSQNIVRVYDDPDDDFARAQMILASAYAGMGFGTAGVHLCHAMSYPISSLVRDYHPAGYPEDHAMVPHGVSVVLTAPAVFLYTTSACPERHLLAAENLGANVEGVNPEDAGKLLSDTIIEFMRRLNLPNGLSAVGFKTSDIPALVAGTLPQQIRHLVSRPAEADQFTQFFEESMTLW
ncbi:MAG: iron-containing alcohol dehydrogenase [Pirellulales bacterium]|nr:iron-containing alcohol dehydrogenase [Pirellulales bacterium]